MREGQVMLITILAISGTILGATTIAGLLMIYQVRQATDIVNSTKAIFAADAGLEWRLYKFYKMPNPDIQTCKDCAENSFACPPPVLANNVTFQTSCEIKSVGPSNIITIKSKGTSGNNSRAFEITLE